MATQSTRNVAEKKSSNISEKEKEEKSRKQEKISVMQNLEVSHRKPIW